MSVIINGTTGIQNPLGSAAAPSESNTTNSNTGAYFPTGTTYGIATNGSNAMYIDASQNVGIGTTSPAYKLDINGVTRFGATASAVLAGVGGAFAGGQGELYTTSTNAMGIGTTGAAAFKMYTNSVEAMRIDSSGNLLVGTATLPISGSRVGISGSSGAGFGIVSYVNTNASTKKWMNGPDGNGNFVVFNDASAGMYMGYGNTSWTSSSDERLKTNLVPILDAANKVSSLRAVTGRFKTDAEGTSRSFLIAQDVQKVLPEAVDASDPDKLGVQYTDVIPLLVAAIQELTAEVTALKAKVGA